MTQEKRLKLTLGGQTFQVPARALQILGRIFHAPRLAHLSRLSFGCHVNESFVMCRSVANWQSLPRQNIAGQANRLRPSKDAIGYVNGLIEADVR